MRNQTQVVHPGRHPSWPQQVDAARIAMDETELATRWKLSVKTVRRWRQIDLGPVFCKLGSRVVYLVSEVEAYERRVSRNSTSARAYA